MLNTSETLAWQNTSKVLAGLVTYDIILKGNTANCSIFLSVG
ncbi:hypothetical protein [Dolichospermum sp. UHCC 0259]|nr:hypothetical protein [Dolichospermum sp. UHCC 0259]